MHWPQKKKKKKKEKRKKLYTSRISQNRQKVEQFFKCLKCSLKVAEVAGIVFSLLTDSVSIETLTETSDCEALNNTDTRLSQNKSGNTKEELNNSNITTINQPAQDLANNINNFPRENKEGTPEKQGIDFRSSQSDSKACVGDTYKRKSRSALVTTKGGEKPSKHNLIWIVDNLPLNLRPKSSLEIKRRITEAAAKKIEIDYTYIPSSKRWDSCPPQNRGRYKKPGKRYKHNISR